MQNSYSQLEVKNSEGHTPILFAAINKYRDIVEYLSLRTKNLDAEDANSVTILMHFLLAGDFETANKLIVRGAKIDYVNKNGNTALQICV